jgi:hypothetical protein
MLEMHKISCVYLFIYILIYFTVYPEKLLDSLDWVGLDWIGLD